LVFGKLFFGTSEVGGVLASFGVAFIGFAARPIGAAIFGHYGDRLGRKRSLVATLLVMGVCTVLIGCLPTYGTIGVAAPILLTLLRIGQGIGVGGEWGGSVLMSMEWGHRGQRGLMASWPQLGVPLGLLLGTGLVSVFASGDAFFTWGWRVPFLASAVLVLVGLYVRLKVMESPAFDRVRSEGAVEKTPVTRVLREQWADVLKAMLVRTAEQGPFYLFTTFVLTYATRELGLARSVVLTDVMIAAAIGLISVPTFGWLSDRLGRRAVYGTGIALVGLFAFPYFGLLDTKSIGLVAIAIVLSLVFHDMMYGPQAALISETFGANLRYSGAGLGYQLASVTAGGPAPLIATAILAKTHSSVGVAWYIVACCVVSMIALLMMKPRTATADRFDSASEIQPQTA
jgi:MFS family permease